MSTNEYPEPRQMQGCCYDCGRKYGDEFGFPDLIVPHDVWNRISPNRNEGGLLCPSCICRRLFLAGIETRGFFTSGPLCGEYYERRAQQEQQNAASQEAAKERANGVV